MQILLLTFNVQPNKKITISDEEVVEQIVRTQSADMVNVLYDRYAHKVYRKCISFVKDSSTAEDLTHDIFIKMYMNLGSFKQKSKFSTWLYSITYNFCIDYLRKSKKMRTMSVEENPNLIKDLEEDGIDDFIEIASGQLKNLLEKVKVEEKMILLMKYQDNLSIKEIQDVLSISESAVKMRIKRAKEKVRRLHAEQYPVHY